MLSAGRSALAMRVAAAVDAVVLLRRTLRRVVRVANLVARMRQVARNVVSAHVQDSLTVRGNSDSFVFLLVFRAPHAQGATRKNQGKAR